MSLSLSVCLTCPLCQCTYAGTQALSVWCSLSVSSYTVRPYQRIIHTLNHVLTRHIVAMLLPVKLGRSEPQRTVILSETCCRADEPVCWHRAIHGNISLMWKAAGDIKQFETNLTELVFPQCQANIGQMSKLLRHGVRSVTLCWALLQGSCGCHCRGFKRRTALT